MDNKLIVKTMILFVHMLIGALIGAKIHSLTAIFFLALLSHFILDRLPHWEYSLDDLKKTAGKNCPRTWIEIALDLFVGVSIIFWLAHSSPFLLYIIFGAFIALLPDGLTLIYWLWRPKISALIQFCQWHKKINIFANKQKKPIWGFIVETTIIILSVWLFAL